MLSTLLASALLSASPMPSTSPTPIDLGLLATDRPVALVVSCSVDFQPDFDGTQGYIQVQCVKPLVERPGCAAAAYNAYLLDARKADGDYSTALQAAQATFDANVASCVAMGVSQGNCEGIYCPQAASAVGAAESAYTAALDAAGAEYLAAASQCCVSPGN